MLLARGHTENQKRLGLSGPCEAIVEAMQKFPLDQEIQEQVGLSFILSIPCCGCVKILLFFLPYAP